MRALTLLLLSLFSTGLFSLNTASGRVIEKSQYDYPFSDPWLASISSWVALGTDKPYERLSFEILPGRRDVPLIENRNKLQVSFLRQKNNQAAPLAFVISGTGGTAFTLTSLWLAQELFALGYHVVTLPNTVNFQYALSVSQSAAPGYSPRDAIEYYDLLQTVTNHLVAEKDLKINGYAVVGYSLGGLLAGFLAQEDSQKKVFNFSKVLMLNPPADLGYAIDTLDNYFEMGRKIRPERKDFLKSRLFEVGSEMLSKGFDLNRIASEAKAMGLNVNDEKWLVGDSFRSDLRDVVFVSQQINDQHFLTEPAKNRHMSHRMEEAFNVTFSDYMKLVIVPSLNLPEFSLSEIKKQSGLYPLLESLKANQNIYVFENQDDFFIKSEDLDFIKSTIREDRFFLYPLGGHCGNFWFSQNRQDFRSVMNFK